MKTKQRNAAAQSARFRLAGAMHDKREPRGGVRNTYRDTMSEYMNIPSDDQQVTVESQQVWLSDELE